MSFKFIRRNRAVFECLRPPLKTLSARARPNNNIFVQRFVCTRNLIDQATKLFKKNPLKVMSGCAAR